MSSLPAGILSLPLDVVGHILSRCGPRNLRRMRLISRPFRDFLDATPSVWYAARCNIGFDVNLPTSGPSEFALAHLMFGNVKCFVCGQPTSTMPHSFALQIKICSFSCLYASHNNASSIPYHSLVHATTLPEHLPYLEGSAGK
ncbi:hypothetical protein DFH09DRAFT_1163485 [Mycena vulgaris]|nr:hypothetical protein DFH09DRAFT_1163485 [Mycena vulgaris]